MKILTLNYEYPPLGGGAGEITRNICKGLYALGHTVSVITAGIENLNGLSHEDGIEIIRLPSKRKQRHKSDISEMMSWIDLATSEAVKFCKQNKPDVVFAHFALPGGEVARIVKKETGIPYVIMSHGHDIPWYFPQQMFFYHLATYFRIKRIYRNAEKLFVQSQYMKKNADRFAGKKYHNKNIVIANGCDTERFPVIVPDAKSPLRIYTGGRMVVQKDPFTLLRALTVLKQKSIPFHLTLAGDGPLLPALKEFSKKAGLCDNITFTGWLEKDKIQQHLAVSNVFVLPSLAEGMSIALLEALCSGIWAIVTPVSGNADLVKEGQNGTFFSVRNHTILAEKLIEFNDTRQNKYPVMPSETEIFREQYAWQNIVRRYEEELKGII